MDSFDYIFGLAALAYIVTSTMFAAERWWHTCPTTDKSYAYPDRRMPTHMLEWFELTNVEVKPKR